MAKAASPGNQAPATKVLICIAAYRGEEVSMNRIALVCVATTLLSTGAVAQTTVVESRGRAHAGAVQIEPEARTRIHSYVTEHKVRPVKSHEKIVVGSPVPRDVELEAVPEDWGPSLTRYRYIYSGDRVMLVDPETRNVIEEVE
jgi:hypothetical protein